MSRKTWVKLPTHWIEAHGLKDIRWSNGEGSSLAAGLMLLIVLAHHMDDATGRVRITYDALCEATGLSRTKVSHGLRALEAKQLIFRPSGQNSTYDLAAYTPEKGWGKLPCHGLYRGNQVSAFQAFSLRSRTELDALKLYLLFVSRRSTELNATQIGYDKIEEWTGINRNRIKNGVSLLIFQHLVNVESEKSKNSLFGNSHIYRLTHLDPRYDPTGFANPLDTYDDEVFDKIPF
jgi:hypothetical protein